MYQWIFVVAIGSFFSKICRNVFLLRLLLIQQFYGFRCVSSGEFKGTATKRAMRSVTADKNDVGMFDVLGSHVPEATKSLSEKCL